MRDSICYPNLSTGSSCTSWLHRYAIGVTQCETPAKFGGEAKLVYISRDIRSRDVKLPAKFSGETKFVYRLRDMKPCDIIFPAKFSRETELSLRQCNANFPSKSSGETEFLYRSHEVMRRHFPV